MSYKFEDYTIKLFLDRRDKDFGAYIEEIPEISAFGDTQESAISELRIVFNEWKEIAIEKKIEIPSPFESREFSGKFLVRLPRSLHKCLSDRAKEENISLNQEVIYCLTRGFHSAA
ncbi:MAG: type II toxin-antitoxin system HicB family antitoxin [Candidatus Eremiobacteraeota bacterium]|nr:type II toxin-antitoxin system HicB family antitoxin [Candidatus Eremiobacteraeota bacterium]